MIATRTAAVLLLSATLACASRGPVARPALVDVQILGFNDFHGALEPPTGANGRIGNIDAGGAAYFAAHLKRLQAQNPNTIVVSAGDNIGATPLLSGMFHDEPTVEALSAAGLQISAVGNHEFDEGWRELTRMQTGGCHPIDGCQDGTPFAGARFQYLAANVMVERPGAQPVTLFPATAVRTIGSVKIGFIGLVLRGTPDILAPNARPGLTFRGEVDAGNEAAAALVARGVKTIVVLIHEGGRPRSNDVNACEMDGPIVAIAGGLSPDIDVVVSGHGHRAYNCTIAGKLVTNAESLGRLITDIDLRIDRRTGDVVSKSARNEIVTRDIQPDAFVSDILNRYHPRFTELASRPVGTITEPMLRSARDTSDNALGSLIADAMLEAANDARVGLWNSGGVRADLVGQPPATREGPSVVSYANAFEVMPFGNRVVVQTVSGATLVSMLQTGVLQVSRGVSMTWDSSRPRREAIDAASIRLDGKPIDPSARIRVVTSDFIWGGGDNVPVGDAADPLDLGVDIELFVDYLRKHSPLSPPAPRIIRQR